MPHLARVTAAIAAAALLVTAPAHAQSAASYPAKPIRFITPFPPGGSGDAIPRLIAAEMAKTFGQPVLVENRPGAGGTLGVDMAVKSPADGYTIFLAAAGALAINVTLMGKLPYDPLKDVAPITLLALIPIVVTVPADSPIGSIRDLVAAARARPGALSFGSAGNGTAMHLSGEMLKLMTGTEMIHIPYRGSGPATADVLAGTLPVAFVDLSSAIQLIRAGKIKGLATAGAKRTVSAPEVPSVAEAGVANFDAVGWFGLGAPAGTPRDIIAKLNAEVNRVMRLPEIRERSLRLGAEPATGTPEEFSAFIRSEIPKWADVIRRSGAKAD